MIGLKFVNITDTTADVSLNDVVRLAIREGYVELRESSSTSAPDSAIATLADVKHAGVHLFQRVEHNGPLETIPEGCIPASGQKLYDATFPAQIAKVRAGHQFAVTELLWQQGEVGNPDAYKGCWSLGGEDEYGAWVRPPKLNRDGAYRAPFLRGSEIGVDAGLMTDDRIRDIVGRSNTNVYSALDLPVGESSPFYTDTVNVSTPVAGSVTGTSRLAFKASRVVPTGPENSPRYHGVTMCIRMFGTVSNPGSLNAVQLATDLGVANAKIAVLENKLAEDIGSTIIYPNGGTAAAPANVATNSRYVLTNPFPNYQVMCVAELLVGGVWADPKFVYSNGGYGVGVSQVSDGTLVLQTGNAALTGLGPTIGSSHSSVVSTPTPCRVKVWKAKGSMA